MSTRTDDRSQPPVSHAPSQASPPGDAASPGMCSGPAPLAMPQSAAMRPGGPDIGLVLERNAGLAAELARMRERLLRAEASAAMRGMETLRLVGQVAQLAEQLRQARARSTTRDHVDEVRVIALEARCTELERQRDAAVAELEQLRVDAEHSRARAATADRRLLEWSAAAQLERPSRPSPSGRMPSAR